MTPYLIYLACFFTSAFIGYRYGRHAERVDRRQVVRCKWIIRKKYWTAKDQMHLN